MVPTYLIHYMSIWWSDCSLKMVAGNKWDRHHGELTDFVTRILLFRLTLWQLGVLTVNLQFPADVASTGANGIRFVGGFSFLIYLFCLLSAPPPPTYPCPHPPPPPPPPTPSSCLLGSLEVRHPPHEHKTQVQTSLSLWGFSRSSIPGTSISVL